MPSSIDSDFYRMAYAPLLVTGAGSFAITAAAANSGARHVRTPGAANLNFPDKGPTHVCHYLSIISTEPFARAIGVRREESLADNWRTYGYDVRELRG